MYIACAVWCTLNSRQTVSPLMRLGEGKERWDAPEHSHSQVVLPETWEGGCESNRTVSLIHDHKSKILSGIDISEKERKVPKTTNALDVHELPAPLETLNSFLRWNWITEGRVYRRGGSGRPRNTNDREDRAIRRVATSAPTTSLASIQRHFSFQTSRMPSRETIRRRLTEVGLRSRRPLRRLPLTPHHRQCRLDFADLGQLRV
ncbi:hypothetical protein TNCV_2945871 [Trichonephila clavipes]|nr:hypothetical protein TNCV_2945871 [Trichonephila clavipes]